MIKLYGYSELNENDLLTLKEVTFYVDSESAMALSKFFAKCAQEIKNDQNWEHMHFSNSDGSSDVIVFNANVDLILPK